MILGSGIYPLLIPALLAALVLSHYAGATQFSENIQTLILKPGYLILLLSTGLFLITYLGLHIPYHPNILTMPWAYFPLLLVLCITSLVSIACLEKEFDLIRVIFFFVLAP